MFNYETFETILQDTLEAISVVSAIVSQYQKSIALQHQQELLTADPVRTVLERPVVDAKSVGA